MTPIARIWTGCALALAVATGATPVVAATAKPSPESTSASDSRGRATAVALNYCRASFHRIRRFQSKRVLIEEQEKILNNLDLNGIDDQEVIRLYSAVLDEIGQVQIAESERKFLKKRYKQMLLNDLAANAFVLGTEIAEARFLSAVRTGVNSWWDFRDVGIRRDLDTWKIDRNQISALVAKTSQFLDTFWKLAQKRHIPDRWLVRGDDLDRLESALQERDLEVRLRVLKRMERFMECYPPYWYHVARTQQALGQLFAAASTYNKLADSAAGHFRKDDMLAASLANLAVIQDYLHQPDAAKTANESLQYSTDVWEANLMAAYVLQRHGRFAEAEDAILRNLDVGLERDRSLLSLLTLYEQSGEESKLIARLRDPEVIRRVPVSFLMRCAGRLGPEKLPAIVRQHLAESLYAYVDLHFGLDDFVVVASPTWQLQNARMTLHINGQGFQTARGVWTENGWQFRFPGILDLGSDLRPSAGLSAAELQLQFPEIPVMHVSLQHLVSVPRSRFSLDPNGTAHPRIRPVVRSMPHNRLQLTSIRMGGVDLNLVATNLPPSMDHEGRPTPPHLRLNTSSPVLPQPVAGNANEPLTSYKPSAPALEPDDDADHLDAPPPPPLEDDGQPFSTPATESH